MANFLGGIITLVLSIVLVSTVVMTTLKTANTTDYTASELAAYGLIGLVVLFGLVYSAGAMFGIF